MERPPYKTPDRVIARRLGINDRPSPYLTSILRSLAPAAFSFYPEPWHLLSTGELSARERRILRYSGDC